MTFSSLHRFALPFAACAAIAGGASTAYAQSPGGQPSTPHESTQLSVPDNGGGMLVDFDPAAKPEPAKDVAAPADAATVDHSAPGHFCSTGDLAVDSYVREAGMRYGVDPCLVSAVMRQESGFRRFAVSPKGASGYMQLMPDTARRFGVSDMFDPRQNILAGTRYLRFLLDRFSGSVELALAGYNAGESAVDRYGRRIPPFVETQNYVRSIATRYFTRHAGISALRPASAEAATPDPVAGVNYRPPTGWRISITFEQAGTADAKAAVTAPAEP